MVGLPTKCKKAANVSVIEFGAQAKVMHCNGNFLGKNINCSPKNRHDFPDENKFIILIKRLKNCFSIYTY